MVLSILRDIDSMLICEALPRNKFWMADLIFGNLTARHEYVKHLYYVDDAEAVIRSSEIGRGNLADSDIESYDFNAIMSEGSRMAASAYKSACTFISLRLWEAMTRLNAVPTGDVLVGKYGTHPHVLVLTRIYMVKESPSSIVSRLGGKRRVFRLKIRDTGQMTWLEDHNVACFSSNGLNFLATATVY